MEVTVNRNEGKLRWVSLLVWLAVCFGVSAVGARVTVHAVDTWYQGLQKPVGTPPDWVFGPVWSVLYALMAVAAWRVWISPESRMRRQGLVWFGAQLAVNLLWSIVFFGAAQLGLGLVDIALMWALIVVTMVLFFKVRKAAGWLMAPYLIWVTYAAYLNWGVWRLNPGFGH